MERGNSRNVKKTPRLRESELPSWGPGRKRQGGSPEARRAEPRQDGGWRALPPAPTPAASPSGLCLPGRCVSERSRRVWAGGAPAGARPQARRGPRHRRRCCPGPAAPNSSPRPEPGGGRPRLRGPGAAPMPWHTAAWTQPLSPPQPTRVSGVLRPSSGPSAPRVAAAVPGSSSQRLRAGPKGGPFGQWMGAANCTKSHKVRPPLQAPAPHTLSSARRRAVGWGQEAFSQWEWIAGRRRGRPLPFSLLLFAHLLPLLSALQQQDGVP